MIIPIGRIASSEVGRCSILGEGRVVIHELKSLFL